MRTIKELLQLMIENKDMFFDGLCCYIDNLYLSHIIDFDEYKSLYNFIRENRPNQDKDYSWPVGKIEPRLKWINEQINQL